MLMTSSMDSLILPLMGTAAITIVLLFLPALIELTRPKDAGPRLINGNLTKLSIMHIANMENECTFSVQPALKVASYLSIVLNMES